MRKGKGLSKMWLDAGISRCLQQQETEKAIREKLSVLRQEEIPPLDDEDSVLLWSPDNAQGEIMAKSEENRKVNTQNGDFEVPGWVKGLIKANEQFFRENPDYTEGAICGRLKEKKDENG